MKSRTNLSQHSKKKSEGKSSKVTQTDAETVDTVEEASRESFPASDSPAWKSGKRKKENSREK